MNHSISRRTWIKQGIMAQAAAVTAGSLPAMGSEPGKASGPRSADTLGLTRQGKKIPIIFDSDIGGDIDDTWALLMALNSPELDVRLFCTDAGQGTSRGRLAAKFLEVCGRTDVPVGIGIPPGDSPHNQSGWVGRYQLADYPGRVHKDGVGAIIRTIKESPDPVTVVAIGAVPTIAAALARDPTIVSNARFVGMHGSIRLGYGGAPKPCPESNVRVNPPALAKVLAAPWECTITPLDTCGLVTLKGEKYQKIYRDKSAPVRALIENYRSWLPNAEWMKPDYPLEKMSTTLFDNVAVYLAFSEELVDIEEHPIRVTKDGMTVIDDRERTVRCAMRWKDLGAFEDLLVARTLG